MGLYYQKKHTHKDCETLVNAADQTEDVPKECEAVTFYQPHREKSFAHLYLRWAPRIGQKPSFGHMVMDFALCQRLTVFVEKITSDQGSPYKGRVKCFF